MVEAKEAEVKEAKEVKNVGLGKLIDPFRLSEAAYEANPLLADLVSQVLNFKGGKGSEVQKIFYTADFSPKDSAVLAIKCNATPGFIKLYYNQEKKEVSICCTFPLAALEPKDEE